MSIEANAVSRLNIMAAQADQANKPEIAKALRSAVAIVERVVERNGPDDTTTLRDQLAMTAVPQLMAARNWTTFDQLAEQAYAFADAMLKVRQQ